MNISQNAKKMAAPTAGCNKAFADSCLEIISLEPRMM
jgi:hypothetical protein